MPCEQHLACMQGEHAQAVKSLQEYMALCLHLEQVQAEAQAFCALADCQQVLGNLDGAVQSLQGFLLQSRHHDAQVGASCSQLFQAVHGGLTAILCLLHAVKGYPTVPCCLESTTMSMRLPSDCRFCLLSAMPYKALP